MAFVTPLLSDSVVKTSSFTGTIQCSRRKKAWFHGSGSVHDRVNKAQQDSSKFAVWPRKKIHVNMRADHGGRDPYRAAAEAISRSFESVSHHHSSYSWYLNSTIGHPAFCKRLTY